MNINSKIESALFLLLIKVSSKNVKLHLAVSVLIFLFYRYLLNCNITLKVSAELKTGKINSQSERIWFPEEVSSFHSDILSSDFAVAGWSPLYWRTESCKSSEVDILDKQNILWSMDYLLSQTIVVTERSDSVNLHVGEKCCARHSSGLLYNKSEERISRHLRSPGILRSVKLQCVTDVSRQPIGPIFKGQHCVKSQRSTDLI